MPKTCIIGAGITGLATASKLQQSGEDCVVLESSKFVGGAMSSIRKDGYLAEEGPNSIQLNSLEIEAFFDSIPGLNEEIIEAKAAANKRFIVRGGRLHAVPMNPLQALTTPLWSLGGKLRVLKEPFVPAINPSTEESVADFVRRRLGRELYEYAINPLVGGIYAGDPEQLSLRYGFPKLYALEQNHGGLIRGALAKMRAAQKSSAPKPTKRIISFKEGIDTLPRLIAKSLGESVQTNVSIQSIQKNGANWTVNWNGQADNFEHVIVTTPAHALSKIPFEPEIQKKLSSLEGIEYPPVSVLSLGYRREQIKHPLDGFGALVPECEQRKILGVLFPSSVFPDRAPEGHVLLTVFIGGTRQPKEATEDTAKLLASVEPELDSLLGVSGQPNFQHHKHWPLAIPQYTIGYGNQLAAMSAFETTYPGLKLAGNYRTGISLTYCLEAAFDALQKSNDRLIGS